MARCGRCAMWQEYPEDHPEKKWAGVCLWYQMQMPEDCVWEKRDCPEFFERIPGWTTLEQWRYRQDIESIGKSWKTSRRAIFFSSAALILSIVRMFM